MRILETGTWRIVVGWTLVVLLSAAGCHRMSQKIDDPSVGTNGGFEHARSGLPVNWLLYSPATVPTGDFELILDREDFKEGRQSLRILVRECSADGGWRSPGIAQEIPAAAGKAYRIGFWIKEEGCDYEVRFGGVGAKTGDRVTLDGSGEAAGSWRHVEHTYVMPEEFERLRFELNVLSPGSLWIDDVKIEPVGGDSVESG